MSFDPRTYTDPPIKEKEVQLCPDVNGPELLRLAEFMRHMNPRFNMNSVYVKPDCDTAGCFLGTAALMLGEAHPYVSRAPEFYCGEEYDNAYTMPISRFQEHFGLSSNQVGQLCYMTKTGGPELYSLVDLETGINTITHLAHTGEVRFDL